MPHPGNRLTAKQALKDVWLNSEFDGKTAKLKGSRSTFTDRVAMSEDGEEDDEGDEDEDEGDEDEDSEKEEGGGGGMEGEEGSKDIWWSVIDQVAVTSSRLKDSLVAPSGKNYQFDSTTTHIK